jgi:site-specific DNA recombinase
MKPSVPRPLRCAIYTRKSTEHNLDLAFNSLDAQREACEAYVKSQAHEGWRLLPEHYDDGGLSGASLDRPALQELLTEVREGRVEVIVVYKVDRLTRSLADFAKLVESFDAHGVSFVSVTQSFNTTSSMGRLTLNVLLSFAQFEREVIGERVRDKIAASKRKGIWVGGPVPFGYKSLGKKLTVVEEDAQKVRTIFRRYLALGSIGLLIADLDRRGIRPKPRNAPNGESISPTRFMVGPLAYLLKNRFYIGEVVYRGEVHAGEQTPIIERELFEAVQAKLAERAVTRKLRCSRSPSFLCGLIFDDRGNRMSPSHANKKGVRYRYYVSQALLQKHDAEAGSISRVAAPDIEELVVAAVRHQVFDRDRPGQGRHDDPATQTSRGMAPDVSDRGLVAVHAKRIVLKPKHIAIELHDGASDVAIDANLVREESARSGPSPQMIQVAWAPAMARARKGIAWMPSDQLGLDPAHRDTLLTAIARARSWMDDLVEGRVNSFDDIARRENKVERHIRRLIPLAFLSPRIVDAIASGSAPADLTVISLTSVLPHKWAEQENKLGMV